MLTQLKQVVHIMKVKNVASDVNSQEPLHSYYSRVSSMFLEKKKKKKASIASNMKNRLDQTRIVNVGSRRGEETPVRTGVFLARAFHFSVSGHDCHTFHH